MSLLDAVQKKDIAAVRAALASGASPDAAMPNGLSALQLAVYHRFTEGVEALLAAGATPDVWAAAALGDLARLRAAPDVASPGPDGFPPLHLAAHFGRVDAVIALLERGVHVDSLGGAPLSNTALHAAAAGGQAEAAAILLAFGAPVDVADGNGYLPLHVAAAAGAAPVVRALLAADADPQARSRDGKTALDYARERKNEAVIAELSP